MIPRRVRFRDLQERGVVSNRITLRNWIHRHGFPSGQLTGPNQRTWTEDEVQRWLDSRPTASKPAPASLTRRWPAAAQAAVAK